MNNQDTLQTLRNVKDALEKGHQIMMDGVFVWNTSTYQKHIQAQEQLKDLISWLEQKE